MPAPRAAAPLILALACAAGGPGAAWAQAAAPLALDTITVTAPPGTTSAASTSRVDRDALLTTFQGADLPAILNTLPGVTTETTPGDPAIAVNIRGMQGKGRVVVTIDGARQNFAKSDHGPDGTFYADPEMLRAVSVVRGPAGADAAAGAIGGTLALRTIEAADVIAAGATQGGTARLRYGTLTKAPTGHLAFARQVGTGADVLVAATRSQAGDYESGNGTPVAAAETTLSGLAKTSFAPADAQRTTLTLSGITSRFRTGTFSGFPRDTDLATTTVILNHAVDDGGRGTGHATVYRTATSVDQRRLDAMKQPTGPSRSYTTTTTGLRAQAEGQAVVGRTDHALTFVLDAFRDAVTTDDPAGSLTPSGDRTIGALQAQDAIALTPGLTATAALRLDSYQLTSDEGAADGTRVSPALTLHQQIGAALSVHATIARAYRPPTLSEALVNGLHPEPADFYVHPNPSLKPESALTTEIGATLARADLISTGDSLTARLAIYRNTVTDFIGLVERGTLFDRYFLYDNVAEARIDGAELEIAYDSDHAFASLSGQLIDGTDETTGRALSGIAPGRLVLTGGWRNAAETLEIGSRLTLTGARTDALLSSDAWHTLDIFLTRAVGGGSFGIALNNVTNETYTQYLTTQPSPGFNALASLSLAF